MDFFKKILAVLAGIIIASLALTLTDQIIDIVHPLPDYIYASDKAGIAEHYINTPLSAHIIRIIGWALGGFLAGALATHMAPVLKPTYAYFCGLIFLCATIFFIVTHPGSPWWLWLAGLLTWIPMTHAGYVLVAGKRKQHNFNP